MHRLCEQSTVGDSSRTNPAGNSCPRLQPASPAVPVAERKVELNTVQQKPAKPQESTRGTDLQSFPPMAREGTVATD